MDKVVLVTGAGRGIGAAIARAAGKAGYRVVVNYGRSREAAEAVVRDIVSGGGQAIAVQGDVASESDVVQMFQTVDDTYGRLDALVNNAGIIGAFGRVDAVTAQSIQELLAINVTGAFICAREAIGEDRLGPQLKKIFGGVYIANEKLTKESAEQLLTSGDADAVAFGQWFIANPDLPERLKRNAPLNAPRPDKFYAPTAEGYTDYPALQANG